MTILIVEDEEEPSRSLCNILRGIPGLDARILTAGSGEEALALANQSPIDVAFVDIILPGMDGLAFARRLTNLQENANIVLVTAFPAYSLEGWKLHASDFLLKPVNAEHVRDALNNLRHPLGRTPKRLRVQCFGNFAVFCGNERLHFKRSGAKELLAYLVCRRGASVSSGELCSVLWEDDLSLDLKKSYIRTYFSSLKRTLQAYAMENVVRHTRDSYSVNTELLDCDYYHYIEMDPVAINSYHSEFMQQYSWAESLAYQIEHRTRR